LYGKSIEISLKILIISQYFWPENFRINDLVSEWKIRGHEVTVLTGIPNYPMGKVFDAYKKKPQDFMAYEGAKIIRVPVIARGSNRLGLALNYASFVISSLLCGAWRLRGVQADVIFVYEPSPVTVGLPAVWLGKIKKIPVVFWALDLWPDTLAAVGAVRSPIVLRWIGRLVQYIYNRCTLVLGQSRGFMGSIANYCNDPSKIRFFPSWAEEVFMNTGVNPAPELPVFNHAFTVLFAGNIGEAQDMPAVLDAAEQLRTHSHIRWVIVGDGRKSDWLYAEVMKRGLQDQVLMPGRFPIERMPSFYAHADALLVSLKSDPVFSMTIPGKVQTYLTTGIPLLGMLDGEGAAVIQDAQAGLTCVAGDSAGLVKKVLELAAMSPEKRQQLGKNGQNYVLKEFGRSQLMDRIEQLLLEAMSIAKVKAAKVLTQ
jgi:glycosyltransferase involved in cell wall biosynthesis